MNEENNTTELEGKVTASEITLENSQDQVELSESDSNEAPKKRTPRPAPPTPTPGSSLCPFLTRNLPGLGGCLLCDPEHFIVDEIPAYAPCGEGTHYFVHVEKRDITHASLIEAMATAAQINPREIGAAGRKDRHAITRQWISMPCPPVDPEDPAIRILEVSQHTNKLRMGHLKGNRFDIHLSNLSLTGEEAEVALRQIESELNKGFPNYFGHQRVNERNIALSFKFLRDSHRRVKDPKFLASIAQSAHFNAWLGARVATNTLHTCFAGDVLRKRETGGLFVCEDPETDQKRMDSGELDLSGPIYGEKSVMPTGESLESEMQVFEMLGISQRMLSTLNHFAPGSRRAARVVPSDLKLELEGNTLHASFTLPKGSFATVLLGEISHQAEDLRTIEFESDND